jgi:hypothetical protein
MAVMLPIIRLAAQRAMRYRVTAPWPAIVIVDGLLSGPWPENFHGRRFEKNF